MVIAETTHFLPIRAVLVTPCAIPLISWTVDQVKSFPGMVNTELSDCFPFNLVQSSVSSHVDQYSFISASLDLLLWSL